MEHLPIPRDPISGHPTIRLSTKQFHEPGPFLEYPERHAGLLDAHYPHVPSQADALQGRFTAALSSMQVIDYYQGWLFYSLIQEVLQDVYKRENYMSWTYDDQGGLDSVSLSTRTLHEDLASLRANGPLASITPGDDYHQHIQECLDLAFQAFDVIRFRFPGFLGVFAEEMLCLASLAETLDSAVQTALERGPVEEMGPNMQHFPESAYRPWFSQIAPLLDLSAGDIKGAMVNAGWCPGDITKARDSFDSIGAFYYLSKFKADSTGASLHKDCPEYGCGLRNPAEPKHMSEGCDCPGMVTLDEEHLIKIYQKGEVPCFSICRLEDGDLGIALTSCSIGEEAQNDPDNHYVALSHVWSEGMGNAASNSLPFCQLAYVQRRAAMAYQTVEGMLEQGLDAESGVVIQTNPRVRPLNIWIDTMCCPATPGYGKNLCLSMMREIYSNAYAVLVRSTVLEEMMLGDILCDTSKGVVDPAAQLYLSPWMRRMWTLQEGVLAGALRARGIGDRLCLSFSDGIFTLESLIGLLKQAPEREALLAFRLIAKFRDLSPIMWQLAEADEAEKPIGGFSFFLQMLTRALKYRNLTVASDEVICLATLLNLRIKNTRGVVPLIGQGQTPEEGMCELWRKVEALGGGLPPDIVFSRVPRVEIPGFRWAPRTLVQYAKYGDVSVSHSSVHLAKITDRGLHVNLPGARLVGLAVPETVGRHLPRTSADNDSTVSEGRMGVEKDTPLVLMVKIPSDGDRWFAVRVRDDACESGSIEELKGDLLRLIKDGYAALIFQNESIAGPGLLVSTTPTSSEPDALATLSLSPKPILARSGIPVYIGHLLGNACVIAEAAHRCVVEFHRAVVAEARQRGAIAVSDVWEDSAAISRLLEQTAEKSAKSSKALKEALCFEVFSKKASATDKDVIEEFMRCMRHMAYIGGGLKGELCAEDQDWFVD